MPRSSKSSRVVQSKEIPDTEGCAFTGLEPAGAVGGPGLFHFAIFIELEDFDAGHFVFAVLDVDGDGADIPDPVGFAIHKEDALGGRLTLFDILSRRGFGGVLPFGVLPVVPTRNS